MSLLSLQNIKICKIENQCHFDIHKSTFGEQHYYALIQFTFISINLKTITSHDFQIQSLLYSIHFWWNQEYLGYLIHEAVCFIFIQIESARSMVEDSGLLAKVPLESLMKILRKSGPRDRVAMVTGSTPEQAPLTLNSQSQHELESVNQSEQRWHRLGKVGNVKFLFGYIPSKVSLWTASDEDMMFYPRLERVKRNHTMF